MAASCTASEGHERSLLLSRAIVRRRWPESSRGRALNVSLAPAEARRFTNSTYGAGRLSGCSGSCHPEPAKDPQLRGALRQTDASFVRMTRKSDRNRYVRTAAPCAVSSESRTLSGCRHMESPEDPQLRGRPRQTDPSFLRMTRKSDRNRYARTAAPCAVSSESRILSGCRHPASAEDPQLRGALRQTDPSFVRMTRDSGRTRVVRNAAPGAPLLPCRAPSACCHPELAKDPQLRGGLRETDRSFLRMTRESDKTRDVRTAALKTKR
jgi:hypothetical protein